MDLGENLSIEKWSSSARSNHMCNLLHMTLTNIDPRYAKPGTYDGHVHVGDVMCKSKEVAYNGTTYDAYESTKDNAKFQTYFR